MSSAATLSTQDLEDLHQIRGHLPADDPRLGKIDTLVQAHNAEPTQFEKDNAPAEGSALERGASGVWSGIKAMNPFQGGVKGALENSAEMATGLAVPHMLKNAYDEYKQGKEQGQGTLPSIAGAAGSSVGLDTAGIRERAQHGDVAGVVGEALPSIVSTIAAPEAGNIGDAAKEGVSKVGQWGKQAATRVVRGPGASGEVTLNPLKIGERELNARLPPDIPKVMGPTMVNPGDIADPNTVVPQGPTRVNPEQYAEEQNRVTPQGPTRINKPVDELREQIRAGNAARLPVRMAPPEEPPPPVYGPTRINETPGGLIPEEPGPIQGPARANEADLKEYTPQGPTRVNRSQIAAPDEASGIAAPYGRGGESQIGSNAPERQVQTIMQKNIVTPEEQSFVERSLGPNARMRPGEGITDWRARVTGLMKAARARTK